VRQGGVKLEGGAGEQKPVGFQQSGVSCIGKRWHSPLNGGVGSAASNARIPAAVIASGDAIGLIPS
jgi:hypothetical protein